MYQSVRDSSERIFQSVKGDSENLSSVRKSGMESSGKFSKSVTELLYNINFGNVPWVIREECFSNLSWTTQENFTISHGQLWKFSETAMDRTKKTSALSATCTSMQENCLLFTQIRHKLIQSNIINFVIYRLVKSNGLCNSYVTT